MARSRSRERSPEGQRSDRERRDFDSSKSPVNTRRESEPPQKPQPSPSRLNRDISSSRERSRERERRRRKMQAECIRRAGGFQRLADSEGKEPVRLFWDGFQWVAKTAQSALSSDPALMNSTRKLRRLYFGNLPLHMGLTETSFQDVVWQEMRKRGYCNNPDENPVLCVWFAKDKGNYGFVEFSSVEETERALMMDGMECMGVSLKVSRPNDYSNSAQPQSMNPLILHLQGSGYGGAEDPLGLVSSRVVRLVGIVQPSDLEGGEEEYTELFEDIVGGCHRFGEIRASMMLTPQLLQKATHLGVQFMPGDVLMEFSSPAAADSCLTGMSGRKYLDRPIQAAKVPRDMFEAHVRPFLPVARTMRLSKYEEGAEFPGGLPVAAVVPTTFPTGPPVSMQFPIGGGDS